MSPERLAEIKRMALDGRARVEAVGIAAYDRMVAKYHQRGLPTTELRQVPMIGCGDEFPRCGELGCEAVALELIAEIERLQAENGLPREENTERSHGDDW